MDKKKIILIISVVLFLIIFIAIAIRIKRKKQDKKLSKDVKQLVDEVNEDIKNEAIQKQQAQVSKLKDFVNSKLKEALSDGYQFELNEINEVAYPEAIGTITKDGKSISAKIEHHKITITGDKIDLAKELPDPITMTCTWTDLNACIFKLFNEIQ